MVTRRGGSSGTDSEEPSAEGPPDPTLPMLSVAQAQSLVALYREALAERGIEAAPGDEGTLVAPGLVLGLHNLAVELSYQPWSHWRAVIDEQADEVHAAVMDRPAPAASEQLRPWLVADGWETAPSYPAPEALPGIRVGIAIELDGGQGIDPNLTSLTHLGNADELLALAIANLRAQPPSERHDIAAVPGEPDSVVHALLNNDRYGAARVLLLDEVAAALLGSERPTYGRLVAVPNQHTLLVHEPSGPGLRTAISLMVQIAQARFRDGTGPISPHVYYLPAGAPAEQITEYDDAGAARIHLTRALQATFDRLDTSTDS